MPGTPLITLLTDFGRQDTYVGQMHVVLAALAPQARVIDLTHEIPPQQRVQAAVVFADAVRVCPPGTIHVVVVDPGVGSARRAIAAEIGHWTCIAPDNGVLTAMLDDWPLHRAVELTDRRFHRAERSATFHGRDLFAPVAAHLANGVDLEELGPLLSEPLLRLPLPQPTLVGDTLHGTVLWQDRFGNLITNIRRTDLLAAVDNVDPSEPHRLPTGAPTTADGAAAAESASLSTSSPRWQVEILDQLAQWVECYAAGADRQLLALFGSSERLELSVKNGSAAERFPGCDELTVHCRIASRCRSTT